ncbi:hypothetical protein LIER_07549 [Lithospermum erythrorhizon]|uniref:Uncharacterized protein n=1 Tax=Lithospermum erythrorhizon TaxID=34254 RepID=A0AAV3PAJ1_LITER
MNSINDGSEGLLLLDGTEGMLVHCDVMKTGLDSDLCVAAALVNVDAKWNWGAGGAKEGIGGRWWELMVPIGN